MGTRGLKRKIIHFLMKNDECLEAMVRLMGKHDLSDLLRRSEKVSDVVQQQTFEFVRRYVDFKKTDPMVPLYVRGFLNGGILKEKYMERLLLITDHGYKFSKSDPAYTELFAEDHYVAYIPGETLTKKKKEYPFTFVGDPTAVLRSAMYGDQLTVLKLPEAYNDRYAKNMHMTYHNSHWDIHQADQLIVEKNYSMGDIRVLLQILKKYYRYEQNGFCLPDVIQAYKQIGFDESADLLRDARIVYRKQQMIGLRSWIDQQIKANGQIHIFEKTLS